jgi:hypothetical protein
MSFRELTMIDVKEVLRRWQAGQSARQMSREGVVGRGTAARYIEAAKGNRLTCPVVVLAASMTCDRSHGAATTDQRVVERNGVAVATKRADGGGVCGAGKAGVGTLRWWSSRLGRDTRAEHGPATLVPLEVAVASAVSRELTLEIAVGDAVVRCEVGADVSYVAALVRALRED